MEKQEAQELLVNAMGSLFTEAEIEAQIAEAAGVSREELNKIIENGEEMPECIKNYRKINQQRKTFEEKLITHELREKGELADKSNPALNVVFSYYPQFQQEYEILKTIEYISETGNGLKWQKTKQSLAEYFGNLPLSRETKKNNVQWKAIEVLFGVKDLKHSFSNNGNSYGKNKSKDYKRLIEILGKKIPR